MYKVGARRLVFYTAGQGDYLVGAVLQKTIPQSTTEEELVARHIWGVAGGLLLNLFKERRVNLHHLDSPETQTVTSGLSTQAMISSREYHLPRESVGNGRLFANYFSTALQLGDTWTKNLPKPAFPRLRQMVIHSQSKKGEILLLEDGLFGGILEWDELRLFGALSYTLHIIPFSSYASRVALIYDAAVSEPRGMPCQSHCLRA